MKVKKTTEFIVIKDSKTMIFVDNLLMIGGMFLLLDINYMRWGGNFLVTIAFIAMLLMIVYAKGEQRAFTTKDKQKAIDYIKKLT